jgi:anti-anti-sigma factor
MGKVAPDPGDTQYCLSKGWGMSAQPGHSEPRDIPHPVTRVDTHDSAVWCSFSCTTESLGYCAAGEIIVLRVAGEVDLYTLPVLRAAMDDGLDQHPAHLIIDVSRMTFCSAQGLDLLTQTGHTTTKKAIGYAVSSVLPQIDRIWTLCWDGDLPIRYHSTAAAITAIRTTGPDLQPYQDTPRKNPNLQKTASGLHFEASNGNRTPV